MSSVATRRPTNVSLDRDLVDDARALGINLSQACERGLSLQIRETRQDCWLRDNLAALASSNDYVDTNGLPLADHRQF